MKKLLFLLLFIPLVSFGQLTFKDVMSISSLDQFKRVMIENNYEYTKSAKGWVEYGFNIVRDSIDGDKSSSWTRYNETDDKWEIQFSIENSVAGALLSALLDIEYEEDTYKNPYDLIVEEIKEKCTFFKILNSGDRDNDYSCYSCPPSSYKGKIGFMISEGRGYIRHFP